MSAGTPLPWMVSEGGNYASTVIAKTNLGRIITVARIGSGMAKRDSDATYIVTACNAYPKLVADRARLVECLREISDSVAKEYGSTDDQGIKLMIIMEVGKARTLLADLGASGEVK